ncbi:MAG: hypothetical protein HP046_07950 [Parabacteroides sp.]|nr:hypothetical protein [Parabacteroides sp.]
MKKNVLYILLIWGSFQSVKGEVLSFSQEERIDSIFSFFSDIESRHEEKQWLHLDKPYYAAGDTIWFRAYLSDAATLRPDTLSNFIYVDLFDRRNKLIASKKIKRDSIGFANNLYISDTLSAGEYTLQAYTGWMLNFDPSCFFQKNILIGRTASDIRTDVTYTDKDMIVRFYDKSGFPLSDNEISYALFDRNGKQLSSGKQPTSSTGALFIALPTDSTLNGTYAETRLKLGNGTLYKRTFFPEPQTASFDIQFLPEGGHLVSGTPQIIAFKAVQSDGYPADVSGTVLNQAGDTIARFRSEHEGMGTFLLTPQLGQTYRAVACCDTLTMSASLPAVQNDACALTVTQSGNNLRYRVLGTVPQGSMLVAHTRGVCHFVHSVTPDNPEGLIKTDSLPEGILHLLLADSNGIPRSERLVYLSSPQEQWQVTLDKPSYGKREKIIVNLALEKDGQPLEGTFSVSVTDANTVKTDSLSENIRTNLLLTSDLKGYIHNPGYYFLDDSPARRHYLDLVMMTHGWRRFKTDDLFNPEPFTPKHYIEHGQYISGHVKTLGNKIAKLAQVDALAINQRNVIGSAVTDSSGYFTMAGLDFQDTTVFLVSSKNKKGRVPYNVSIDTLYPRPSFQPLHPFLSEQQRQFRNYDLQRYLASFPKTSSDGIREYELEGVTVTARNPNRPRMSVRGTLYDTADLTKFKQVPLLHYVSFLPKVMRSGNQLLGRVIGGGWIPIGLTVNRMDFNNIDYLRNYTVGDVEYINVIVPERVEIYLKPGAGIKPDFSIYKTIGYSENAEFYHPVYDTSEKVNDKTPDQRTTLYWNPYLQTGLDGKAAFEFYSADSDNPRYEITLEGVTPEGSVYQYQQKIQ